MNLNKFLFILLLMLMLLLSFAYEGGTETAKNGVENNFTIIYTGKVLGEIEPCG